MAISLTKRLAKNRVKTPAYNQPIFYQNSSKLFMKSNHYLNLIKNGDTKI